MADVFISYAREDRAIAEHLAKDLEAHGISVWWDAELVGSDDYQEVILTALSKARAAVVIWTKASVKSLFVRDEARYALHYKKLVAVKQPALDVLEIPFGFQSQHTDNVDQREQVFRAVQKLGVKTSPAASPVTLTDTGTGWDAVKASSNVDDVLKWLEANPADTNHTEAIQRIRHLIAHGSSSSAKSPAAKLVQTSNFSAFLSGLTFRIPSFQLSTQGTWSSIGFAVGFILLLGAGFFGSLFVVSQLIDSQSPDLVIGLVGTALLLLLTYGTWRRFASWAEQRNFLAAFIVMPFFLLLAYVFALWVVGISLLRPQHIDEGQTFWISGIAVVLGILAVIRKVRSVR